MTNILLLGGNGFLGRNIISKLAQNKTFSIFSFDLYEPVQPLVGVQYYCGNLSDEEKIDSILREKSINIVIHLVSTLIPASTVQDYENDCNTVYNPTVKILELCVKYNTKFIYMSSGGTIYGNQHGIISEDAPATPISYYGFSKLQMESLIKFYHRVYGLEYLILRPSNPYGVGQNLYGKQGIIAVSLGKLLKNETLTVFGDGSNIRDYIYIDDYTLYIEKLIENNISNQTFNIGSGKGYSITEVLETLQKVSGKALKIEHVPSRKNDVPEFVLDISRINSFIPCKQFSLEEGIRRFYNYVAGVNK